MRLPYELIAQHIEDLFHERVNPQTIATTVIYFASYYHETEEKLIQSLLKSPFIHIDETEVNIEYTKQYVWIFSDGIHVVFKLSETREADIVHDFLGNYDGIVISDFYAGYDSVKCKQQKCWIHLIRNLNNDLWKNSSDAEFESLISGVRDLIIPILEAIQKHGSKKRHLAKFKKEVTRFYNQFICEKIYYSETANKYQKLFERYRESLFTFLEEDFVPWNNNTAERAIIHFSTQRKISRVFSKKITPSYLLMLSISQSCKFQEKSLLDFLLSGEKEIGN